MCLVLFLFGPYRHILRELSVRTGQLRVLLHFIYEAEVS